MIIFRLTFFCSGDKRTNRAQIASLFCVTRHAVDAKFGRRAKVSRLLHSLVFKEIVVLRWRASLSATKARYVVEVDRCRELKNLRFKRLPFVGEFLLPC